MSSSRSKASRVRLRCAPPPKERQDILRDLSEYDVVARDDGSNGADAFVSKLGRRLVECGISDVKVYVVDAGGPPRRRLRREVDHVRSECGDRPRRDGRTVDPQSVALGVATGCTKTETSTAGTLEDLRTGLRSTRRVSSTRTMEKRSA